MGHRIPPEWMGIAGALCLTTNVGACMELEEAPDPVLISIQPARAYSDQPTRVSLRGQNLLPSIALGLHEPDRKITNDGWSGFAGEGIARVELRNIRWRSKELLEATLLTGLPMASAPYPVTVIDPRGRTATLAVGFDSLGADRLPPTLSIEQPAATTPLAPGMTFGLKLRATDAESGSVTRLFYVVRANGIVISQDECHRGENPFPEVCTTNIRIPESLAKGGILEIAARAEDASIAVNSSEVTVQFVLVAAANVTEFSPQRGGERGGNEIVIRGQGFISGTKAFLDGEPISPDGGHLLDTETIVGRTPPHAADVVDLEVRTPTGNALRTRVFVYAQTPIISNVSPAQAPEKGATPVTIRGKHFNPSTRVLFGDRITTAVVMPAQKFVNEDTITGYTPAGTGSAAVWVLDPELGATPWSDRFSWAPDPVMPQ
jgi:IPT/TIG domain